MIGIHTPEFEFEKSRKRVVAAVEKFGKTHPVMMDNDYTYWKALDNRYWPSFYLVDRKGFIVQRLFGEMHAGTQRARAVEEIIELLLDGSDHMKASSSLDAPDLGATS